MYITLPHFQQNPISNRARFKMGALFGAPADSSARLRAGEELRWGWGQRLQSPSYGVLQIKSGLVGYRLNLADSSRALQPAAMFWSLPSDHGRKALKAFEFTRQPAAGRRAHALARLFFQSSSLGQCIIRQIPPNLNRISVLRDIHNQAQQQKSDNLSFKIAAGREVKTPHRCYWCLEVIRGDQVRGRAGRKASALRREHERPRREGGRRQEGRCRGEKMGIPGEKMDARRAREGATVARKCRGEAVSCGVWRVSVLYDAAWSQINTPPHRLF